MGACLRSLYLSRAGAVAGAVAGVFSRPCPESRSRRLGPALATRCMRRLLFIAPGTVAGAPSPPSTGDAARACPRFVAGWGGGERSRRDRCRSAFGHVALEKGTRYYLTDPDCHSRFCGEALGTSAALCTVCSHRTIALYEGGYPLRPSDVAALRHTRQSVSAHNVCACESCISPEVGIRRAFARRSAAVSHWTLGHTGGTARTHTVTLTGGIGHLDARRISTPSWGCRPLGSERPVSGSGA